MKIRGNTVGTTLKPEKILAKATNLTEEEKAQVRKNIGVASAGPVWDEDIVDLEGASLHNVHTLQLRGYGNNKVYLSAETPETTEPDGYIEKGVLAFYDSVYDSPVVLRNIADGENDNDAATVGQMNEALSKALVLDEHDRFDAGGREINNVGSLEISHGSLLPGVRLEIETPETDGYIEKGVLAFADASFDTPVILTHLADGEGDSDAVTVRQLNAALAGKNSIHAVGGLEFDELAANSQLTTGDLYIITDDEGSLSKGEIVEAISANTAIGKGIIGGAAKIDVWETVADITIPEGYASNVYEITKDIYGDMQAITDFYIQLYVPQQTAGVLNGNLYIRLIDAKTNYANLIAVLTTWNHASYNLQGTIFSQCFGDIRQTSFYNLGANGVSQMPMNTLLVPRPVEFKGIQISLSDNTLTLPSGTNIKVVGRKK